MPIHILMSVQVYTVLYGHWIYMYMNEEYYIDDIELNRF